MHEVVSPEQLLSAPGNDGGGVGQAEGLEVVLQPRRQHGQRAQATAVAGGAGVGVLGVEAVVISVNGHVWSEVFVAVFKKIIHTLGAIDHAAVCKSRVAFVGW